MDYFSQFFLYKKFGNHISTELKQSNSRYYYNYFSANCDNIEKVWSGIKTVISHKSNTSSTINKIEDKDGNVTSDSS